MLRVLLALASATSEDDPNITIDAPKANISQINDSLANYYTKTVLYVVSASATVQSGATVQTMVVLFVPTLYLILKAVENLPSATPYIVPPSASPALKYAFFAPAYSVGVLFGVLFLGGAYYTYQCYRPKRVAPPAPPPRRGPRSSDSSMSSDSEHKVPAAAKQVYKKGASGGKNARAKRGRV
jgi:hypothetical protein